MDQNTGAPDGAHHAEPAEIQAPRPVVPLRAETNIPPHLDHTVTDVPVTPGIDREAYESQNSDKADGAAGAGQLEPSFFSRHSVDHAIAASPAADITSHEGQSFQNKIDTGAQEGSNFMRRLSAAVLHPQPTTPSRESMSEIRGISPDLALTGNIISATFNLPHSLKYHKGADWVCKFSCFPLPIFLSISRDSLSRFGLPLCVALRAVTHACQAWVKME
jgi:trehalose 6-phosphate synthase/phosphatase